MTTQTVMPAAMRAFGEAARIAAQQESKKMVALGRAFNDAIEAARRTRA